MFLLIQRRHGFLNLKSHCLELYIFFTISVRVHSGRITSVCVLWECIVYIYIEREREREREWLCISDGMLTDIVKEIYIYTAGSWEEQIFQLGEIKKSRNGWNLCSTMGEIKKKLELKSMSWSPWEWTETHVSLIASDLDALGVMPWPFVMELKAGAHTHMHTHTHTHTPGSGGAEGEGGSWWRRSSQWLSHCHTPVREATDEWQHVRATKCLLLHFYLPNHSRLSPVSHANWKHTEKGILRMYFNLAKLSRYQVTTQNDQLPIALSCCYIFRIFQFSVTSSPSWPSNYCSPYAFSLWHPHLSY